MRDLTCKKGQRDATAAEIATLTQQLNETREQITAHDPSCSFLREYLALNRDEGSASMETVIRFLEANSRHGRLDLQIETEN